MCGIMGYTGGEAAVCKVIAGLHSLEYRGYDSAGVAFFDRERIRVKRSAGKIANLERLLAEEVCESGCAIGHTRWATHGAPSDRNSHPHGTERLQLVHNGIIENYASLKEDLEALGYKFDSDTDTEVAAKLIDFYRRHEADPVAAIRCASARMSGSYAFGIIFSDEPGRIYATRRESPLIVGISENGSYIASDVTALLRDTRDYYRLENGEIALVDADSVSFRASDGRVIDKELCRADWDPEAADRGEFEHYMLKEISEEPRAVARTLSKYTSDRLPAFSDAELDARRIATTSRIRIIACGTALHAGMYGRMLIERFARIPTEAEIASEFRYRDPILSPSDTVIVISQSGETADTLAALKMARDAGCYTVAIVNVVGSSIARNADSVIYTCAGPEIAVASTKAYTVQTALMALVAVRIALIRGRMSPAEAGELVYELNVKLPDVIERVLTLADRFKEIAEEISEARDLFFIGRGQDHCAALEASLKLKEISYIHSEAYAAGELKHGSISLVERDTPVIALSTCAGVREKMISNIKEVTARGAYVISLCVGGEEELSGVSDETVTLPGIREELAIISAATALQLIAYYTALLRGCDVDQPRNLAKSVTVE